MIEVIALIISIIALIVSILALVISYKKYKIYCNQNVSRPYPY